MIRLAGSLGVLLFLFAPLASFCQKPATIAGNVYFETDANPAKNVMVELYNAEHALITSGPASDSGRFDFGSLRRAVYYLRVEVAGYERAEVPVDVSMVSDKSVTVYLRPLARKDNSPASPTVSVHELSMPSKARAFMASGKKKLYQDKDPQAALPDLEQALANAPNYYEAEYELALTHLTLGHSAEAEKLFRSCFERSGHTYGDASVRLGGVLLDRGDVADAEDSIRAGLRLRPNYWLAHYELGRALLMEKHLDASLASAEQARTLAPSASVVYRLLSNIHLQQHNYPALLADLDTYLTLDPDSQAGQRARQIRDEVRQKISVTSPGVARTP